MFFVLIRWYGVICVFGTALGYGLASKRYLSVYK